MLENLRSFLLVGRRSTPPKATWIETTVEVEQLNNYAEHGWSLCKEIP